MALLCLMPLDTMVDFAISQKGRAAFCGISFYEKDAERWR